MKVSTIGRFYLQGVRPDFKLYVTPLQINPEAPALPICTPADWSKEIYKAIGYYYTQTFPQQHKAFINDILNAQEYWQNAQFVLKERQRTLDYLLDQFKDGLFFFYFSSVDINGHMLWRYIDPEHPDYRPDATLKDTYGLVYSEIDKSLGHVLDEHVDENTTVIVMSDHGFSRFYYGVNINSWLVEKGLPETEATFPTRQIWRIRTVYQCGLESDQSLWKWIGGDLHQPGRPRERWSCSSIGEGKEFWISWKKISMPCAIPEMASR